MTIASALNVQNRTVSFRDAEVLLGSTLGVDRAFLHAHTEVKLTPEQAEKFETALRRREANEPVAYITGSKEFYGRQFTVDTRALIPRPETEHLIEQAVPWCSAYFNEHTKATNKPCPVSILELGTGCGNIAVTLACELAAANIPATLTATDISPGALELASENWQRLNPSNSLIKLSFLEADLFNAPAISGHTFDLIIANLPYVETTWQVETGAQPDVIFFEPDVALFGGTDGLELYRRFLAEAPSHLADHGSVMIEYGDTQTALIKPLITAAFPDKKMTVHRDYAGLDRVITLKDT